jgi:two-component system sensor histidine kinase KdpD
MDAMKDKRLRGNRALTLMYEFTRDLAGAGELDAIVQTILTHVGQTFGRQVAIWLVQETDALVPGGASPGFRLDQNAATAAEWAFANVEAASQAADSPTAPGLLCLPLKTPRGAVGVLGLDSPEPDATLSHEQLQLLEVFASQAALAIERAQLAEHARDVRLLQATEKLQQALLHSISHDLRTPLVTITVALSNLEMSGDRLDEATRQALARTGRQEAERLNRLVGNLLDISRIEAGALRVTEEPCDVEEAIGVALDRLAPEPDERPAGVLQVDERPVSVEVGAELPPVPMDLPLMVQALVNVLDNAVKYSPDGTQIDITASQTEDEVQIRVADRGIGILPEELAHVFDKFHRVHSPAEVHGSGLGLAISKGIVEAHGGRIWAEQRPGGGTTITIALPIHAPLAAAGD